MAGPKLYRTKQYETQGFRENPAAIIINPKIIKLYIISLGTKAYWVVIPKETKPL
jgi:fumarate reductase subunit C